MDNEILLEVKNLGIEFIGQKKNIRAVDGVSFNLQKGELLGIVGESGCGKTVTALSILRLLPSNIARIFSGEIIFEGNDIFKLKDKDLRKIRGRKISMIFQEPVSALNPIYPVGEQIAEVIRLHQKLSSSAAKNNSIELLNLVGISDAAQRWSSYPHQLSGGMCQRVMIAIALACRPQLLIADEPTTALDVTVQTQILELLIGIQREFSMSVMFITHDLSLIAEYADRIIVMYAGEIVESAPVKLLFNNPLHPYSSALIRAIPTISQNKEAELPTIPGSVISLQTQTPGCRFYDRCSKKMAICSQNKPDILLIEPNHYVRCHLIKNNIDS